MNIQLWKYWKIKYLQNLSIYSNILHAYSWQEPAYHCIKWSSYGRVHREYEMREKNKERKKERDAKEHYIQDTLDCILAY